MKRVIYEKIIYNLYISKKKIFLFFQKKKYKLKFYFNLNLIQYTNNTKNKIYSKT